MNDSLPKTRTGAVMFQPTSRAIRGRPRPRTCGVLVVDDDEGVRNILNFWLHKEGFTVWVAAGGRAAVDRYDRQRDAIEVVLLDVHMPDMDGPRTLAALRGIDCSAHYCFMSGQLDGYSESDLRDLGVADLLYKPFELAAVTRMIHRLIDPVR